MPSEDDAKPQAPLEELPELLRSMVREALVASHRLATLSIDGALAWPLPGGGPSLRRFDTVFRFSLTSEARKVRFGVTRKRLTDVLVDAEVSVGFAAGSPEITQAPVGLPTPLSVLLPALFWLDVSAEERARCSHLIRAAGEPAASAENSLLIRLGHGVLAVYVPHGAEGELDIEQARLQYTPYSGAAFVVFSADEAQLDVPTFVDLIDGLARWTAGQTDLQL